MPKRHAPHLHIRARFGERIRKLRRRRGWGQIDLAVESGISRQNISLIENGRIEPLLGTVEALAGSFDLTISQLMKGV
jgi:XRE family transcriptional regulator, regulator of sulfur utilization